MIKKNKKSPVMERIEKKISSAKKVIDATYKDAPKRRKKDLSETYVDACIYHRPDAR